MTERATRSRTKQVPGRQHFGSLAIDRRAHEVTVDGQQVPLSRSEFNLLSRLTASPRTTISHSILRPSEPGDDEDVDYAPLHVSISRLRRKLREAGITPRHIVAVHGYGYRFEPEPDIAPTEHPAAEPDPRNSAHALIGPDRALRWLSDNVHALLGWDPTATEGVAILDLIHPDDWPTIIEARPTLDIGQPVVINCRFLTPRGDVRRIECRCRPFIGPVGTIDAVMGAWRSALAPPRRWRPRWEPGLTLRSINLDPGHSTAAVLVSSRPR